MIKNFINRLLIYVMVYPFCVFIIVKGYNMGFGSSSYTNILSEFKIRLSGIFMITIALVFLISDITKQIKKAFFKNKD
jgi:hypothetical protein